MKKTDITKEELIALLEEGKTLANIAELYGVGSSTPSRWCKKFGIDYKNTYRKQGFCELDEEKILEMHKTMTAAEIARQLNVNSNRIIKIFRKHNIIAQKTKPKVSYEEIKRLNSEGYTDTQIAEILNKSPKYRVAT